MCYFLNPIHARSADSLISNNVYDYTRAATDEAPVTPTTKQDESSCLRCIGRCMISTARFALHLVTSNFRLGLSLIVVPVAVLLGLLSNVHPAVVFVSNLIAVIPLSILLTIATESLAKDLGPTAGALLNISCGNLAEIIIL